MQPSLPQHLYPVGFVSDFWWALIQFKATKHITDQKNQYSPGTWVKWVSCHIQRQITDVELPMSGVPIEYPREMSVYRHRTGKSSFAQAWKGALNQTPIKTIPVRKAIMCHKEAPSKFEKSGTAMIRLTRREDIINLWCEYRSARKPKTGNRNMSPTRSSVFITISSDRVIDVTSGTKPLINWKERAYVIYEYPETTMRQKISLQ